MHAAESNVTKKFSQRLRGARAILKGLQTRFSRMAFLQPYWLGITTLSGLE